MRVLAYGRLIPRTYEQEGQKQTVLELIAEAAGPDLRFATAEVHRKNGAAPAGRRIASSAAGAGNRQRNGRAAGDTP
jgi:hypothetical protein